MAFEHHPGLAALHAIVTGQELSVEEAAAEQKQLEEITKDIADDAKVERQEAEPVPLRTWKGFGS